MTHQQNKNLEKELSLLIKNRISETLQKSGKLPTPEEKKSVLVSRTAAKNIVKKGLKEALFVTPDSFTIKTEKLSRDTTDGHQTLYKKHVDTFNKISSELDTVNRPSANSFSSLYRSLKMDECSNLNSIKLHELYFNNISDLASEIAIDTIPYIKLSRIYGTFEAWQFDFMACAMSSNEGWAMTVYEPYRNTYMNICVDGNDKGVPVGCIPVLVVDMWSHAFFKDYQIDKKSYLIAMMREINWDVVEARMAVAEKCELESIYRIKPIYNDNAGKMIDQAEQALQAPVDTVMDRTGNPVPPTTPAYPTSALKQQPQ
jgi:Fe-Mn family superoxide dismutase